MCGATREGCFFTNNSCSLTKGVVNYHEISWCCFCVKIYSYFNTFSLEQLIVTSQTDVLAYANKIDARKMRNRSPAIVRNLNEVTGENWFSPLLHSHTLKPMSLSFTRIYGCRRVWIRLCSTFIDKSGNFLTLTETRNQRTSLSSELTRVHYK